ncbi:MAG: glycosyltransferase [Cyanobacteria bacterium SIG28]|nr:glycosyltransferase [Cyanobacteria bacterium SIG28]
MPKISVLIPVYGVEKYLKTALDSVLKQTLSDIEIILIDDGGRDNCPQIIDEYAQKDSRIVAIHKQNGGYGHSMNIGLSKATGEYIAILEPDDYIEPNMYEDLYNIAQKFNSDLVKSCFYDNLESKEETRIKKTEWKDFIPEDKSFTIKEYSHFLHYHPSIWSCIYKKDFLDKHCIKFVEAPGAGWTDNLFQVQTLCLAERINYTSNAYYYWRRINFNESDDIKDYTIPFKRSDEIHQWLDENNIKDENILANLYNRELGYVELVFGKKNISDKEDCFEKVRLMIERMDKNIIKNSELITPKQRKFYNKLSTSIIKTYRSIKFKNFKRNILSIKLSKKEKRIVLFGKVLLGVR